MRKLVLIETNPFDLLAQHGRQRAYAEAVALRDCVKTCGDRGEWAIAAERFADYWGGAGTWRGMRLERRAAFAQALMPNYFEWDAVMNDGTTAEQWAALLPNDTLLISDSRSALPIREITAILRACVSGLDLPGRAGRRSHGTADAPRPDQSARPHVPCAHETRLRCEQNHISAGLSRVETPSRTGVIAMRIALYFERVMQALHESREREASRVVSRHAHFLAQADDYERTRAVKDASARADAKTIANAKSMMAQAGLQFAPRSTP